MPHHVFKGSLLPGWSQLAGADSYATTEAEARRALCASAPRRLSMMPPSLNRPHPTSFRGIGAKFISTIVVGWAAGGYFDVNLLVL